MTDIDPKVQRYTRLWAMRDPANWPEWYRWDGGWYEADGDNTRYCVWPHLTPESVVFEVGGYEGKWAKRIADAYDPIIHLFEPAPRAMKMARDKLEDNPKVYLHEYGLGAENATLPLGDSDRDGASFLKPDERPFVMAQKRRFIDVVQELGVTHIHLMAVNIEGCEFEFLPHLVDTGWIENIDRMMIQWHAPGDENALMQLEIQERIAVTHTMSWNHAAWEAWEKRQ